MSASSTLPLRGASPAAIGTATAAIGGKAAILTATIQAISTAGNMNELIDTIPSRYRPILAPILRDMQDIHGKFCNAQKNLATLKAHQTNGTWPTFLAGMHDPFASIQMSKEARSPLSSSMTEATTWFKLLKEEALSKVISLKEAEVLCLENLYLPPNTRDRCSKALDIDWASLKRGLGKYTEEDAPGKGIAIPKFFSDEFHSSKELVPSWVAKCWDFTRIKSSKLSMELEKKTELARKAQDEMDTAPDGETLTETVQKAVAAALRQQNKPAGNKRGRNQVSLSQNSLPAATNSSLGKRKEAGTEEVLSRQNPEHQTLWYKSQGFPEKRRKTETSFERKRVGSPTEEGQEDLIRSKRWSVRNPSSLPKEILDLPEEQALSIIRSRVPLTTVSNADIRIKLGPGVLYIPEKIDEILSLGHRFLSPPVFNKTLPTDAFSSLATRVKWRIFFANIQGPSTFLDKNPQYRIPKPETTAVPDTTPKWVEDMLDRGKTELTRQIRAIPNSVMEAKVPPKYRRDLTTLQNWRKTNNYLVLQSDKNLGTTVVSSEWYNEKLDALVINNRDFELITDYHAKFLPVFDEIQRCENRFLPAEVKDFILAGCDVQKITLPRFHGLPKIHKDPWALRPIVPCHSYPLANASKVLSHILKLRVEESPWILESTQELARLLEKIRIPSGEKYWLCTGDVTAMYPNIPRQKAHQILGEFAREVSTELEYINLITKLAQWSDNYLVFEHKNNYYYQKEGLAMGIPAAPDVANLYMAHFENSFAGEFLLYKRYIDDVFVLVKADSKKAVLEQLSKVKADGLTLTWSVEEKTCNFLDLSISFETGYLSFKPYRKPLNSYERLPFTSAHPLHVKRAAFLGEVSRIARLCSKHDTYYNEIAHVRDIYLKRAYPPQLLHTWIRQESRKRWDSRYTNKPEAIGDSPLFLKSVYNDVWKHIDLRKVWSAMETSLNKAETPLAETNSVMLSLRKFRNLGEINNKHNADVQKASLLEEERADSEMDDASSTAENTDYTHMYRY